jgi:hypothetical protein
MRMCDTVDPPTSWEDVISEGVLQCRNKSLKANVCRLVFGSTVYNICRNRNEIKHGSHPKLGRKSNGKLELGSWGKENSKELGK